MNNIIDQEYIDALKKAGYLDVGTAIMDLCLMTSLHDIVGMAGDQPEAAKQYLAEMQQLFSTENIKYAVLAVQVYIAMLCRNDGTVDELLKPKLH